MLERKMEKFKEFENITKPDRRNLGFCKINNETGETNPLELKDIYNSISSVQLANRVPEQIISQFNVAKNLTVYSWFSYSFHQIAELKAYSTLEMALRLKIKKDYGLKKLLQEAVRLDLIKDKGFSHIADKIKDIDATTYSKELPKIITDFRNKLAHGSTMLHPGAILSLRICADIINQLFNNKLSNNSIERT